MNNSINNSVKKSNLKESGINNEASPNYLNNQNENLATINEEENDEINQFRQYQCTNTISENTDKIITLIQLKSGLIATGSLDCKIRIWDIENTYRIKEIEENGNVLCLLEFEENILLSGNDKNEIYLRNIISENQDYIFNFSVINQM